jgi:hypothetical protein
VKRELSPVSRLPLVALAVVIATGVVALLFVLDPSPHHSRPARAAYPDPPAVVYGAPSPLSASAPRSAPVALAVGRRFLRLYARLQSKPLGPFAARQFRSLASLALTHTLLAQPHQPAGDGHARATLARVRVERLSASAILLHAAVRHGDPLLRVRCLVQRDHNRWTVTALTAAE